MFVFSWIERVASQMQTVRYSNQGITAQYKNTAAPTIDITQPLS